MADFIEINFSQGFDIQHEIIPTSALRCLYIELPEGKSINFDYESYDGSKIFRRKELFRDRHQCECRWNQIRRILGCELSAGKPQPYDPDEARQVNQNDSQH